MRAFFISNFKKQANIFDEYFVNQCTINVNDSVLPNLVPNTDASLSYFSVTTDYIINIINNLSSNKAHDYDGTSVSMLTLCASEVAIPLQIIFQDCIDSGMFPDSWKYVNVQPIYKKIIIRLKVIKDPFRCYPLVGVYWRTWDTFCGVNTSNGY